MSACFEFVTEKCEGLARFGEVQFSAGFVNTATLRVEPSRVPNMDIGPNDPIVINMVPEVAITSFEVFRGLVSRISRVGALLTIECVTATARAGIVTASPRAWENATVRTILLDILGVAGIGSDSVSLPDAFSSMTLHVWNTNGDLVSDEVQSLLASVAPGTAFYAAPDGILYVGDILRLAPLAGVLPYPLDETQGVVDLDISKFLPRPAIPFQIVFDPSTGDPLCTVTSTRHVVDESGSFVDLIFSDDLDPALAAEMGAS